MSVILIRLRRPLHLKTGEQRIREAITGWDEPPVIIPARTTLRIVDFFEDGVLALAPDGRRLFVDIDTCRDSAYIPRA